MSNSRSQSQSSSFVTTPVGIIQLSSTSPQLPTTMSTTTSHPTNGTTADVAATTTTDTEMRIPTTSTTSSRPKLAPPLLAPPPPPDEDNDAILNNSSSSTTLDLTSCTLRSFLTNLLSSPTRLISLASTAFLHPFHFSKLVLHTYPDGSKLRLHYWHGPQPFESPHNHGWNFTSCILRGELKNTIYTQVKDEKMNDEEDAEEEEKESDSEQAQASAASATSATSSTTSKVGKFFRYTTDLSKKDAHCHLEPDDSRTHPLYIESITTYHAGCSYSQHHATIHSSQPLTHDNTTTITLLHQSPTERSWNHLYKSIEQPQETLPPLEQRHPLVGIEKLKELLEELLMNVKEELLDTPLYTQQNNNKMNNNSQIAAAAASSSLLPVPCPSTSTSTRTRTPALTTKE